MSNNFCHTINPDDSNRNTSDVKDTDTYLYKKIIWSSADFFNFILSPYSVF